MKRAAEQDAADVGQAADTLETSRVRRRRRDNADDGATPSMSSLSENQQHSDAQEEGSDVFLGPERALVFSGGTAFNAAATALSNETSHVSYTMPVSDNGGSTAEIMRVLGGPAIGDIRSRLLRLASRADGEQRAVLRLLGHRLPSERDEARSEWHAIVEGRSVLWRGISEACKHMIRAYLVHFQYLLLQTESVATRDALGNMNSTFDFSNGSIGNFFFTGARKWFHSLQSAIMMWCYISSVPRQTHVLPVLDVNHSVTLGAELSDGTVIYGQNHISHPPSSSSPTKVDKSSQQPLSSRITRLFYLNEWHQPVVQQANPEVIRHVSAASVIVYGMGSLYTSVLPCLLPCGVGEAVASKSCNKVLILNGWTDRETHGFTCKDFITAVMCACKGQLGPRSTSSSTSQAGYADKDLPPSAFVSVVIHSQSCTIELDEAWLKEQRIRTIEVPDADDGRSTTEQPRIATRALARTILSLM